MLTLDSAEMVTLGNSLLCGTSSDKLRKLQVTQNVLVKVVCQALRTCSATELHWLPVKQRIEYKLAVLTYKTRQSGSPPYLLSLDSDHVSSRSLRSSDKLLFRRPYTSIVMADKAFSVSARKIWNELSFSCCGSPSVNILKLNSNYFPLRTLIIFTNQSPLMPLIRILTD